MPSTELSFIGPPSLALFDKNNFIRRRSLSVPTARKGAGGLRAASLLQLPKIIYAQSTELAAAINKNNGGGH